MNAAPALVADGAALAALEPEWWDLWRRCPAATPFQSPAWAIPWWNAFAPGRLAAVAVRLGGRLAAFAPVYREDGPFGRRLLPVGIGAGDYLDVLVQAEGADAAARELVRAVDGLVPDWESWELEELGQGAAAADLSPLPGWKDHSGRQSASPVLVLDAEEPVPAGKRRKLRMAGNRVARRGGEVVDVGPDDLRSFMDDLVRLHGARWTSHGEGGAFAFEAVEQFHRSALPALAAAGLARLWTLRIEGRVVGAYYGLHHGRRAYAYLGGFDPDFAFESPGTVLVGHAIDAARREGATEFHFLRGQEAYKYEWGAVDRWNTRRSFKRRG